MPSTSTERSGPLGWLRELRQQARSRGHRRMLLVEGDAVAGCARAAELWQEAEAARSLWVGTDAPDADRQTDGTRARQWLGRELDLLVWNLHDGLHPDGFAALSGTLVAGGLLVLVAPPLGDWATFADSDYDRVGLHELPRRRFLERLARLFANAPQVLRMGVNDHWPDPPSRDSGGPSWQPPAPGAPTREQQRLIALVERVALGHRRRPLVVSADRGRGKSAGLGMAAAALLKGGCGPILVTAPHRESLDTLFRHAAGAGQPESDHLAFVPPDVLLRESPDCNLLIVDEAAAIPPAQLTRILARYPRIVFATTLHGYEGTGRGFMLRFAGTLERETPQWRRLSLAQPVRWAADDPLEALINDAFLLDAEAAPATPPARLRFEPWPQGERLEDELRLREAYGLLVEAHYRTTPGDLRRLLDDPDLHLWLALADDRVVGVISVVPEGGLEAALGTLVFHGERRLRGHLLPQSLANHGGDPQAPGLHYGRIQRIAVHPEWRRQRVAARLVDLAARAGSEMGWDLLGTSFSIEPGVLSFWRHCRLHLLRLGLQQQTSSGEHSAILGRGLSHAGRALVRRHRRRFAQHWPHLLNSVFTHLPGILVWQLSQNLPVADHRLDSDDQRELRAFADGFRLFELSLWPLRKLGLAVLARGGAPAWSGQDIDFWVAAVFQQHSWEWLRAAGWIKGRRQGERRLRGLTGEMLAGLDGAPDEL